jgi:hypothetical protein
MKTSTLALGIALVLGLPACQRMQDAAAEAAAEQAAEAATGQEVDVERNADGSTTTTVETADGTASVSSGENLQLPADFPGDVHLPDGYSIRGVFQMGGAYTITLRAQASVGSVFEDYHQKMTAAGWQQQMASQNNEAAMLVFQNGQRNLMVNLVPAADAPGSVDVSLTHSTQQ